MSYRYLISKNARLTREQREVLLTWLTSHPQFRKRKPTPAELIKECHRRNSPLRCLMIQDQKEAAQTYWFQRAQYLLRHIEVVRVRVTVNEKVGKPVRAYIPVRIVRNGKTPEENYVPAQRVANNPSLKRTVVQNAYRDLKAWIDRYERYAEFFDVFQPVADAFRQVESRWAEQMEAVA